MLGGHTVKGHCSRPVLKSGETEGGTTPGRARVTLFHIRRRRTRVTLMKLSQDPTEQQRQTRVLAIVWFAQVAVILLLLGLIAADVVPPNPSRTASPAMGATGSIVTGLMIFYAVGASIGSLICSKVILAPARIGRKLGDTLRGPSGPLGASAESGQPAPPTEAIVRSRIDQLSFVPLLLASTLAEGVALCGFMYWTLTADRWGALPFLAAASCLLALCYPRPHALYERVRELPDYARYLLQLER